MCWNILQNMSKVKLYQVLSRKMTLDGINVNGKLIKGDQIPLILDILVFVCWKKKMPNNCLTLAENITKDRGKFSSNLSNVLFYIVRFAIIFGTVKRRKKLGLASNEFLVFVVYIEDRKL